MKKSTGSIVAKDGKIEKQEKADRHQARFKAIEYCIFLSGLSVFAQLYLFQPILPEITQHFKITPATSSLLVSASTIGMGFGLFIFAFKADSMSRKRLMTIALVSSSVLTLLSSFLSSFVWLVAINFTKGVLLSGVSAVALAYLSEEVSTAVFGFAVSLYLSGNTFGGMAGRVVTSLISGWTGWRIAVVFIGVASLVLGLIFSRRFPESRFFKSQNNSIKARLQQMKHLLKDTFLLRLYFVGFILMGSFVSVYNYLGFRLEAAPFSLPHYVTASIFLMYTFGIVGSLLTGWLSDKYVPHKIIQVFLLLIIAGLLMMMSKNIFVLVLGLGLFTLSFFGVHSMASQMVSKRVDEGKSSATSLYWLFYYIGSSVMGSFTGIIIHRNSWYAFVICLMALVLLSLLVMTQRAPKVRKT
ncbi:MFS transporter [Geofilum sp. OHC36d9]|uniref:MFS transporter n=1 Tax=Geofilum sp. OHC36d9 TaxID=3458413 RepID=UPI004033A090